MPRGRASYCPESWEVVLPISYSLMVSLLVCGTENLILQVVSFEDHMPKPCGVYLLTIGLALQVKQLWREGTRAGGPLFMTAASMRSSRPLS